MEIPVSICSTMLARERGLASSHPSSLLPGERGSCPRRGLFPAVFCGPRVGRGSSGATRGVSGAGLQELRVTRVTEPQDH